MTVAFRWNSASLTDVGKVRQVNEDACLAQPQVGLWVVADGMGGHDAGDVASQAIVESLGRIAAPRRLSSFVDAVEDHLQEVNGRLVAMARDGGEMRTIGSTVVALLAFGGHCVCMWAGDSRAYRYRDGGLQRMTRDHSQVEELIERGELLREDAESHPAANVITRAVGAAQDLYVDLEVQELAHGDRYLLCSDGLFKELNEDEIARHMAGGECAEVCRGLIRHALERGSRDNVTVVVVDFEALR